MTQITFIATCHNESREHSPLIDSLLAQKNPLWKLIVYNNGPRTSTWEYPKDDRITYIYSDTDTGMWGCQNREHAIKELVSTPYVISTSIQDYYLANAVEEISKCLQAGADLVCWQAINHLFRYGILNGEIAWGHIDWGQWCVKTEYIKATGVVHPENFSGDWHTLQTIIQRGFIKNHQKVERILTIHN